MFVLYAAKKYMVSGLIQRCVEFICRQDLSPDTLLSLLEQSIFFEEPELKAKVLEKIIYDASAVLACPEFENLSAHAFHELLLLDEMAASELELFLGSLHWARAQCKKMGKPDTGHNLREALGENLWLIRFPVMKDKDLDEVVEPLGILTSSQWSMVDEFLENEKRRNGKKLVFSGLHFNCSSRIDPRKPHTVKLQGPTTDFCKKLDYDHPFMFVKSKLKCHLSKPIVLSKIWVRIVPETAGHKPELLVSLDQDRQTLHKYHGTPYTRTSEQTDYAVEVPSVQVQAGPLEIDIRLQAYLTCQYIYPEADIKMSLFSLDTHCLQDKFITLKFEPVKNNLLLGLEYALAA